MEALFLEGLSTEGVVAGSTMIVFVSVFLLPIAVWDSKSGRYRGYLDVRALGVLLFSAVYFGILSYRQGNPSDIIMADIGCYLFLAIAGSRVMVESAHRQKFGVKLRHQYHKLTDHDDGAEN